MYDFDEDGPPPRDPFLPPTDSNQQTVSKRFQHVSKLIRLCDSVCETWHGLSRESA